MVPGVMPRWLSTAPSHSSSPKMPQDNPKHPFLLQVDAQESSAGLPSMGPSLPKKLFANGGRLHPEQREVPDMLKKEKQVICKQDWGWEGRKTGHMTPQHVLLHLSS